MSKRKIYLENGMLVKTIDFDMSHYWLDWYQKLHLYEPGIVEVYGYQDRKIYMEFIDGQELFVSANHKTIEQMISICQNILNFSKDNNINFYHHDLHFRNFLVENETNRVVLIDPDSFHLFKGGEWI
tara:strand:+ start:108 stop:488 length:381 start_codon:yes stop_codon:yes gene_type:complete